VGTNLIVMATPIFDDHSGFLQRMENLAVEKFVAKLRVEAFAIAVFPRAARLDIGGLGLPPEKWSSLKYGFWSLKEDSKWLGNGTNPRRSSPSLACGVDDGVVGVEHAVGKPVAAQILPDVPNRVEFRRARWEEDRRNVFRHAKLGRRMPACAIEQQDSMRALGDMAGYLVQVKLHAECVGIR
jgi:hypothetical protein